MDSKRYDRLRERRKTKDFEGKNSGLDKWLYRFSFFGNFGSIFFAYFLIFPILFIGITNNFIGGFFGEFIAIILSISILLIFESVKRYVVRNFSNDFVGNDMNLSSSIFGWFLITIILIGFSFYLSIDGSKNLISNTNNKKIEVESEMIHYTDSINEVYVELINPLKSENIRLREYNDTLRNRIINTTNRELTIRKEYQNLINLNTKTINENDVTINNYLIEKDDLLNKFRDGMLTEFEVDKSGDFKNVVIFVIIVIFNELLIICGIFFREYYEDRLYRINSGRYEKVYQKRDRYKILLNFIYENGRVSIGDKVVGSMTLKEIISEKTRIQNGNKIVDEFFRDMDALGVFSIEGKRRYAAKTMEEAIDLISDYDDISIVLDSLK